MVRVLDPVTLPTERRLELDAWLAAEGAPQVALYPIKFSGGQVRFTGLCWPGGGERGQCSRVNCEIADDGEMVCQRKVTLAPTTPPPVWISEWLSGRGRHPAHMTEKEFAAADFRRPLGIRRDGSIVTGIERRNTNG